MEFQICFALARSGFSKHCFVDLSESFIFEVSYFRTIVLIFLFGNQSFHFIIVEILVLTFDKDLLIVCFLFILLVKLK